MLHRSRWLLFALCICHSASAFRTNVGDQAETEDDGSQFGVPPAALRVCQPQFFTEGEAYFKSVYEELERAEKEVIIAGWVFDSETFNLAGQNAGQYTLFESWLTRAAKRGVKIWIQFWFSSPSAFGVGFLGTMHVKERAERLHSIHANLEKHGELSKGGGIYVFIDTGRAVLKSIYWSWHIKALVIDGNIAYAGGFDFSLQRWDTADHLKPDHRRNWTEMNWMDAGVRVVGEAAVDLRTVLVTRHTSYCLSVLNDLQFNMLEFSHGQDLGAPCDHMPSLHTDPSGSYKDADPVGTCKTGPSTCHDLYSSCTLNPNSKHSGHLCMCNENYILQNGTCVYVGVPPAVAPGVQSSCEVLITGSWQRLDVHKDRHDIMDEYIADIRNARSTILISNQYFISQRSGQQEVDDYTHPQNEVGLEIWAKLKAKIDQNETFSVVIFVTIKTGDSHMPTMKTLFDNKDEENPGGLKPKLIKYLRDKGSDKDWRDYLAIAFMANVADAEYLERHGVPTGTHGFPPKGKALFYPIFLHTKAIVTPAAAQVGSANVNDRSLLGSEESDAELNIRVVGRGSYELLEQLMQRYTLHSSPLFDKSAKRWTHLFLHGGLAREINNVAFDNNQKMAAYYGLDFESGEDRRYGNRKMFPGESQAEQSPDGKPEEKKSRVARSTEFAAMMQAWGQDPWYREVAGPRPALAGFIYPWTENIYGDPYDKFWLSIQNTNPWIREIVN